LIKVLNHTYFCYFWGGNHTHLTTNRIKLNDKQFVIEN